MGEIVIAAYRPKPGAEKELLAVLAGHVPTLRRLGLATARPVLLLRAADGVHLEIFEWADAAAAEKAHHVPEVQAAWKAIAAVAEYVPPAAAAGMDRPFPHFAPVDGVVS
jgi:quinol monooxygenase YgiN